MKAILIVLALMQSESIAAPSTSEELKALFDADQKQRDGTKDWNKATPEETQAAIKEDVARAKRVREILATQTVEAVDDLIHAGTVLMHNPVPEDALAAHVVFTAAGFKGSSFGRYSAALALDRYLWLIKRPQALGTYGSSVPQENIITDETRRLYCVATPAERLKTGKQPLWLRQCP
jgi:hypothetical protein